MQNCSEPQEAQPRKPLRYFGPRLFHKVPDCREALQSGLTEWQGLPSACSTPLRLFFSLIWFALSAALVGSVLLWIGYVNMESQPRSIAGLVVLSIGALLAMISFSLWLGLICGSSGRCGGGKRSPCCLRCQRASRIDVDSDNEAILSADGPEAAAAAAAERQSHMHMQEHDVPLPRFLPPLEPVYLQEQNSTTVTATSAASERPGSSSGSSLGSSESSGSGSGSDPPSDKC